MHRSFAKNYTTNSCVIAPLVCHGRVVGVLNLSDKETGGIFTQEDIAIVELFRQLVGASIGNIHLFEKTQRQARTDGLTGMLNLVPFTRRWKWNFSGPSVRRQAAKHVPTSQPQAD